MPDKLKLTRRKFFQFLVNWAVRLIVFCTALGGTIVSISFMFPPRKLMQRLTGWMATVDKNSIKIGETAQIIFNGTPFFILRGGADEYTSFSAVCPHAACIVRWHPDKQHFGCPCHESDFDSKGKPSGGPATEPLTEMALKIDKSGMIYIKLV